MLASCGVYCDYCIKLPATIMPLYNSLQVPINVNNMHASSSKLNKKPCNMAGYSELASLFA